MKNFAYNPASCEVNEPTFFEVTFALFPNPVKAELAAPIMDDNFFPAFPSPFVEFDNLENEFEREFVALFIFTLAVANCAKASVILIVFSLILGAVFITLKNDNTSFASVPSWLDVCPILFPALANCAID